MRIIDFVNEAKSKVLDQGGSPDIIAMKGTAYQQLLQELEVPIPTLFGIEIVIKPDHYFSGDVQAIVADNMSLYPPIVDPKVMGNEGGANNER